MHQLSTASSDCVDLAGPRLQAALPEREWSGMAQERHRYRGWVWPGSQLSAVGAARLVALEALADWRLGPMADDVALCVSELVTNALTHALVCLDRRVPRQVVLGLRYFPSSCLFVEVGDWDPRPPLLPVVAVDADPLESLALGGRGLLLVCEMADFVWWTRREPGGKYVYARLDTPRYFGAGEEVGND